MAYDNRDSLTLSFPAINIGAGTTTRTFRLPKGFEGKLIDIIASVTTAFVGTTTPGRVRFGVTGNISRFGVLTFGAAGAGTAAGASVQATAQIAQLPVDTIPKDTDVLVTFEAPTGGAPAGVADVHIAIGVF